MAGELLFCGITRIWDTLREMLTLKRGTPIHFLSAVKSTPMTFTHILAVLQNIKKIILNNDKSDGAEVPLFHRI